MAGNDQADQDAIAAQWEASLESEDPTEAAEAAAANELTESMSLQWAAMVEDGSRDFGAGKNSGERVQYLRVKVVLEVKEDKQAEAIKPSMPRVTDIFQTYIRELRASDLSGSAGLFRLKEELTRRVNMATAPTPVAAVLFKEIVVQ